MPRKKPNKYDPNDVIRSEQVPDDTITVLIKCGGRLYARGVKLADTQEKTAALVGNVLQSVLDTVDAKGLKAGGSRFDPNNIAKEKK